MRKAFVVLGLLNALSLFGSDYPGLSVVVSLPSLSEAQVAVAIAPAKIQRAIEGSFDSSDMKFADRLFNPDEAFEKDEIVFEKPLANPFKRG